MTGPALRELALQAGAGLGAGALVGVFHFLTLRWSVGLLAAGRAPLAAMALQLSRFAVLAAALAGLAMRFGAVPLLAATAGILVARAAAIRLGGVS